MTRALIVPEQVRWTRRAQRIGRAVGWVFAALLLACAAYVLSLIVGVLFLLYAWPLPLS